MESEDDMMTQRGNLKKIASLFLYFNKKGQMKK